MAYNKDNYRRIRTAYQTKYLKAYEEADRRMAELHAKSPALAAIDRELSAAGAKIAMAALGTGDSYRERLAEVERENLLLQEKRAAILAQLGYPADYTLPPYECDKCQDSGFVGTQMCECMRRELILAAYETSGLGALMRTQTFDSFSPNFYAGGEERKRMQLNFELMRAYAEQFSLQSDNLLLMGKTGLGKTHLSTAVARRVIERGFDVYYASALQMFSDFEHTRFGTGTASAPSVDISRYSECELLILDDLGTEVTNQFTNSCLYLVLNNRINLHRPTVISTNLTGKEIKERYADRITSRIFGDFKPLLFMGTDIREQKIKKSNA